VSAQIPRTWAARVRRWGRRYDPPPSAFGASAGLSAATPARSAAGVMSARSTPAAPPSRAVSRTPSPSPKGPTLLGPSDSNGLSNMLDQYCDSRGYSRAFLTRQPTGPAAATGNWACGGRDRRRPPSTIDMNGACRGAYSGDVFANYLSPDDAFSWRCYRR
jgi:hypothetical protein